MKKYILGLALCLLTFDTTAQFVDLSYQGNNTSQSFSAVHFMSQDSGFVVGDSGLVLKTIDAGNSWTKIITPKTYTNVIFQDIFFTSSSVGYIAGTDSNSDGIVLKTTDGGDNWSLLANATDTTGYHTIYFPSASVGYVAGAYGAIKKTVDAGSTWNALTPVNTRLINSINFHDNLFGLYCNTDRDMGRTNDGTSWFSVSTGGNDTAIFSDMFFTANQDSGYLVHGDNILLTQDSGATWAVLYTAPGNPWISGIDFVGKQYGYAVGENSMFYSTSDFGASWTPSDVNAVLPNITYALFELSMVSDILGYIVGQYGTIVKYCEMPAAIFTASDTTINVATSVNFTNTSTLADSYTWDFGDGTATSNATNPSHTYAAAGDYLVSLTAHNLSTCENVKTQMIHVSVSISGIAYEDDQTTQLTDGWIYLYIQPPGEAQFIVKDSLQLNSTNGSFSFPEVSPGYYLMYGVPDPVAYPDFLSTYLIQGYFWSQANPFNVVGNATNQDIYFRAVPQAPPAGPGRIGGRLIEADSTNKTGPGDPYEGAGVSLKNSGSSAPILNTTTNSNGDWDFNNLPYGSYQLYVDIPGLGMDSTHSLDLNSSNPTLDDVIVEVDSDGIRVELPSFIMETGSGKSFFGKIYPNPTQDALYLEMGLDGSCQGEYSIFNNMGAIVKETESFQFRGATVIRIELKELPPGVYWLNLTSNLGNPQGMKFVILK